MRHIEALPASTLSQGVCSVCTLFGVQQDMQPLYTHNACCSACSMSPFHVPLIKAECVAAQPTLL
jgi:hypothetical protein